MTSIILPHKFNPRPYQWDTFNAFFKGGYKRFIDIEHRRAGKDKKWLNIVCAAAQQRVGIYLHALPKLNQARKVIWKGIDSEGHSFLDHFPKELIARVDNTEMAIEFKNGSIYRLGGADNFDTWMGTNPVGIIFSEYSLQDPAAWDYFRPIIVENEGFAAFIYTPRGKNHGYDIYENNKNNPNWFVQFLPASETKKNDGSPVLTSEIIEEEREAGMPEEMIQQEFYCSFSSAILGAYYSKEMKKVEEENRITVFPIEITLPVHTFWDLGVNDSTFIWFMQFVNDQFRFIHCYETQGEGMPHYVDYLHRFRDSHGIVYGQHHAPHDIAVRELGTGKTRRETAASLGLRFEAPFPKPRNGAELLEHIHICRMMINKCWFHVEHCKRGIRCLKEYSKEWDEKNNIFKSNPKHDWTTHGSDAFRTFAVAWRDRSKLGRGILFNRVNQGPL
jgi:hypothetical protein